MHSVLMWRAAGGTCRERAQAGLLYYVNGLKMETAAMRAVQQEPHAPRAPRNARRWVLCHAVVPAAACPAGYAACRVLIGRLPMF